MLKKWTAYLIISLQAIVACSIGVFGYVLTSWPAEAFIIFTETEWYFVKKALYHILKWMSISGVISGVFYLINSFLLRFSGITDPLKTAKISSVLFFLLIAIPALTGITYFYLSRPIM